MGGSKTPTREQSLKQIISQEKALEVSNASPASPTLVDVHESTEVPEPLDASPNGASDGPPGGLLYSFKTIFLQDKLNVLLITVPLAVAGRFALWNPGVTFALALVALCPLAERINFLTEQTANHTSEALAAILNVSFGNATELIVSIFALRNGLLRVLQLSLIGSVLSNCLLVLGFSLMFGGLRHRVQTFDAAGAGLNVNLLVLSVIAYAAPDLLHDSNTERGPKSALTLARYISCVLIVVYGAFIWFQFSTHRDMPADQKEDLSPGCSGGGLALMDADVEPASADAGAKPDTGGAGGSGDADLEGAETGASAGPRKRAAGADGGPAPAPAADAGSGKLAMPAAGKEEGEEEEEEEEVLLTLPASVIGLLTISALTAITSDALVSSIEGAAKAWQIPIAFIATILLPIVGNATEHASAVMFARNNKLNLSFGISLGSSVQISIFLLPLCVLIAACMGRELDLDLGPFELGSLATTVLLLVIIVQDGRSHYLRGTVLVAAYLIFAGACACHEDPRLMSEEAK